MSVTVMIGFVTWTRVVMGMSRLMRVNRHFHLGWIRPLSFEFHYMTSMKTTRNVFWSMHYAVPIRRSKPVRAI